MRETHFGLPLSVLKIQNLEDKMTGNWGSLVLEKKVFFFFFLVLKGNIVIMYDIRMETKGIRGTGIRC